METGQCSQLYSNVLGPHELGVQAEARQSAGEAMKKNRGARYAQAVKKVLANAKQMHEHKGPYWERWKARMRMFLDTVEVKR